MSQHATYDFRDRHGHWGRDLSLYLGSKECGKRLNALGAAIGKADYAVESMAPKGFERRIGRETILAGQVKKAIHMLNVET